ncbi:MAG: hypothetical protein H0W60_09735, partial [Chloroflexi bacterium]|nr:hypothetical protein [Chloroflexota bacterium]
TVLIRGGEARLARGGSDPTLERERLSKELAEAERMLAETEARLANESFVKRAPGPIVQAARDRLIELEARVERLRARLSA